MKERERVPPAQWERPSLSDVRRTQEEAPRFEASAALRGLAHATRDILQPGETYAVTGDLLGRVRSLQQVLDQLVAIHARFRATAHDDTGDHLAGAQAALATADELRRAGILLGEVQSRLDSASQHSVRIAWHEVPADPTPPPARRLVRVVFLDGGKAEDVLDLISHAGTDAAIEEFAGYDRGAQTTEAASLRGTSTDAPRRGQLERSATNGAYTLTYNPFRSHVSLLREQDDPAGRSLAESGAPEEPQQGPARAKSGLRSRPGRQEVVGMDPFTDPLRTPFGPGRGMSF